MFFTVINKKMSKDIRGAGARARDQGRLDIVCGGSHKARTFLFSSEFFLYMRLGWSVPTRTLGKGSYH